MAMENIDTLDGSLTAIDYFIAVFISWTPHKPNPLGWMDG